MSGDLLVIYKEYYQLIVFIVIFQKPSNEVLRRVRLRFHVFGELR